MSGVKHTYDPDEVEAVSRKITRERVLQKSLEWNNHCAAGLINQEELRLINLYDKKSIDQKINIFRENPTGIVQLFVTLIGGKSVNANLERSRYGLALIDELLEAEPSLYKNFIVIDDLWTPFMRLMQTKEDPFCAATAVKLVALFILRSNQLPDGVVDDVLRWCNERLRNQSDLEIALEGLQMLLRQNDIRLRFFEEDGLNRLGSIIKSSTNTIIVYKALYCVWVMSYNKQIASKFHTTTLIAHVVEAMRTIQKEKIIRMAIAILVNIADRGDSFQQTYTQNNQQMIEAKIHRVLESLNQKKWADDDLNNDLETLTDIINKNISEMSSWDSYKTELMSGVLEWSPVHTSERFWRENVNKFDEENYEALRTLIALLRQSSNAQNLQIGCHDIGEYVRFHPIGRQIVNKLDGKAVIMRHMEHPDAAVQKEALLCTQKLLVVSWDHLPR